MVAASGQLLFVAFVDDEAIRDFHDAAFHELDLIPRQWLHHQKGMVGHELNINFILTNAHGFNNDEIKQMSEEAAGLKGGLCNASQFQV